jgi:1-deoxy-D-xylulose-5-phosphate reductoisomerase
MIRPLVVLGATGSVGRQTLAVATKLGAPVAGVAARRGSDELAAVARAYPEALVGVAAPTSEERERFAEFGKRVRFGPDASSELASLPRSTVVNGVVGSAGLRPSVAALEADNRLALANKESLVAGGPVVMDALRRGGGELIPVDSEHSAIFQCMLGEDIETVRRLILTASGGPFRGRTREELETVTPRDALRHPTWTMGARITIDSATLANKAFEVIEAQQLFGVGYDAIEVVVHPQSIIHSFVEFSDGSIKAQLGEPDMRVPIQYAITYPSRLPGSERRPAPASWTLTLEQPDRDAFPALDVISDAGRRGGPYPAAANAADEIAVSAFLTGRLGFAAIADIIERTLDAIPAVPLDTVDDVFAVDREARGVAGALIGAAC